MFGDDVNALQLSVEGQMISNGKKSDQTKFYQMIVTAWVSLI